MASDVEISRLALGHVADAARINSISPPDNTIQAQHCATFYPLARDECLEAFAWPFARKRTALALSLVSETDDNGEWAFVYTLPSDYLRAIKVVPPGASKDAPGEDYSTESDSTELDLVLLTNVEDAVLHYIYREEETGRYSPMFITALSYLLGSHLAGPILKGKVGMTVKQTLYQLYRDTISQAATRQLNSSQTSQQYAGHVPVWMSDR